MPQREGSQEEVFPIGRAKNAPSDDVGWHFGNIVQGRGRNTIQCKLCWNKGCFTIIPLKF